MKTSFIYKNVYIYRLIMNLLYKGKYAERFDSIRKLIDDKDVKVLELCFGDIFIADWCNTTGKKWVGIDINPTFVSYAKSKGFDARRVDLKKIKSLPHADICILVGSLYHFGDDIEQILSLMLNAAPKLIISEPIKNLSQQSGIVGHIARLSANAGTGQEKFRFTRETLLAEIRRLSKKLNYTYSLEKDFGRDLVMVIDYV